MHTKAPTQGAVVLEKMLEVYQLCKAQDYVVCANNVDFTMFTKQNSVQQYGMVLMLHMKDFGLQILVYTNHTTPRD